MTEYRASFDAAVRFSNGGDLTVHGFRVDVPSSDVGEAGIAALFVASLGLLMTDSVELRNVAILAEPHKGTRGGPADHGDGWPTPGGQLVELSHVIKPGMITYPGLPAPDITPYLTREASRTQYAPGTEFAIDQLTRARTSLPGPAPPGSLITTQHSSASTHSTSMTPRTANGLLTPCCSPPAYLSSST